MANDHTILQTILSHRPSEVWAALAAVLVLALGYLTLDVLTSLISERAMVRDIILRLLGAGNGK